MENLSSASYYEDFYSLSPTILTQNLFFFCPQRSTILTDYTINAVNIMISIILFY